MPTIIASETDIAGMNIRRVLLDSFDFKPCDREFKGNAVHERGGIELLTIPDSQITAEYLRGYETDLFVFASKHSAKSGQQSLTVHSIGNWGGAVYGGEDNAVSAVHCGAVKESMNFIKQEVDDNDLPFEVSFEATHHGPFLGDTPSVFVELGSDEVGWNNARGAEVIAEACLKACNAEKASDAVFCVGGLHYAPLFTKRFFEGEFTPGFILPKHHLEFFSEDLLSQALNRTVDGVQRIVLDWKGLGKHKELVKETLAGVDLPVERA